MDDQVAPPYRLNARSSSNLVAFTILAICFVLSLLGRGFAESFTVFLLPVSASFSWDRTQVISIYSLALLTSGLVSPLIGRLFDRFGPRIVYSLGLFALGGAFLVAAYGQQLWQFQLSLGLCVGLGIAATGPVPSAILLGRWFGAGFPTAMTLVYSAAGAGVLVLLPLAQLLIDHAGWRWAYLVLGAGVLILSVPMLLLPWEQFSLDSSAVNKTVSADSSDDGWTLNQAIRHHAFWALFSTFFFTAVGMFAISAQVVAYLVDAGFPKLQAATAWGFSGVTLLIGMFSITWLDALIGRRLSVLFSYALSIAGIVMLWLLKIYPNAWLLAGFVISFGSTVGARGPLITATAIRLFHGKHTGTIYGMVTVGGGLGSALGSWSGGLIHDVTGSYDVLLVYALVSVIIGMIPFLVTPMLR